MSELSLPPGRQRLRQMLLLAIGFMLSPISWWNDPVINIPLSYVLSIPFSLLDVRLYLPAFILFYWLSNILGLVMMHIAGRSLLRQTISHPIRNSLLVSLAYTLLILLLVFSGLLTAPGASSR